MNPVIFLRVASVLTMIHSILHTVGGVFGKPDPGIAESTWAAMNANHFMAMGMVRSYAEFYRGLGLGVTIFLTAEAIVFWQLGSLVKSNGARLRPLMATFMLAYLVFAANSYAYFFFAPVVTEILIAACLGMAIATANAGAPARSAEVAVERA
jgi:hypothetical protein